MLLSCYDVLILVLVLIISTNCIRMLVIRFSRTTSVLPQEIDSFFIIVLVHNLIKLSEHFIPYQPIKDEYFTIMKVC